MSDELLKRTPLIDCHREAGARLVDFAGWEMPVQYSGVVEEHRAVRTAAGLFDVSHMGEVRVTGSEAEAFLQRLAPNDVTKLSQGRAHYSALLSEDGTYLDDMLVYRLGDEDFLLVVNASNEPNDFAWIASHAPDEVKVENVSANYALLALQGPKAEEILRTLTEEDLGALGYYRFSEEEVSGRPALISRTGYTGEDGFELYVSPDHAAGLWRQLLEAGEPHGLIPAGLGARDTLRLEAAMALYGHEIDETTTPWEAGLGWTVKMDKGDFLGRSALEAQKESGVTRCLVGFEVTERGIARQGHAVLRDGEPVGRVTSGTWSPTFEKALGMAYVPVDMKEEGTELELEVRRKTLAARVVKLPFYRRGS